MTGWMWALFIFLIVQRLVELVVAKKNEAWMKERGAYETGAAHYKWFVITHGLFFVAIAGEVLLKNVQFVSPSILLLIIFAAAQVFRIWCITSLGRFWNTKIIILPGEKLVNRGPYRFIKHPNYLVVFIELIVIPLLFHAYVTAIVFPVLHLLLLRIRIPEEERALTKLST